MMVVLRDHLNNESAEWLDVEEIDLDRQDPSSIKYLLLRQALTIYSSGMPIFRGRMNE